MKAVKVLMVFCAGFAALAGQVQALDFSKSVPPVEVSDGKVAVADRSVQLPAGKWTFVSYARGTYARVASSAPVPRHTGYFVNTSGKDFLAGLVVEAGEFAFPMSQWNDEACKQEGVVYKSLLESTPLFPECLLINRRTSIHKGASSAFFKQVSDWLVAQQIEQSVAVYDIMFQHYTRNGQGLVRLVIPVSRFRDEAAAIELANRLPDIFRPLLQGRSHEATLPALP